MALQVIILPHLVSSVWGLFRLSHRYILQSQCWRGFWISQRYTTGRRSSEVSSSVQRIADPRNVHKVLSEMFLSFFFLNFAIMEKWSVKYFFRTFFWSQKRGKCFKKNDCQQVKETCHLLHAAAFNLCFSQLILKNGRSGTFAFVFCKNNCTLFDAIHSYSIKLRQI